MGDLRKHSLFPAFSLRAAAACRVPSDRCLVTGHSSGEQFLCISLCAWNTNNPVHVFHSEVSGQRVEQGSEILGAKLYRQGVLQQ